MSIKELESKIRELREMQRFIEEAQAEAERIKDEIKAAIGDSDEVLAGEYKVTYKPVKSFRIDTAALKKAMPDIAQAFTKETTVRRFVVA